MLNSEPRPSPKPSSDWAWNCRFLQASISTINYSIWAPIESPFDLNWESCTRKASKQPNLPLLPGCTRTTTTSSTETISNRIHSTRSRDMSITLSRQGCLWDRESPTAWAVHQK